MELNEIFDEEGNLYIPEDNEEWDDYYYIISKIYEEEDENDNR